MCNNQARRYNNAFLTSKVLHCHTQKDRLMSAHPSILHQDRTWLGLPAPFLLTCAINEPLVFLQCQLSGRRIILILRCFWRKFVVSQVKSALLPFKESLYLLLLHITETIFQNHVPVLQKHEDGEVSAGDFQEVKDILI